MKEGRNLLCSIAQGQEKQTNNWWKEEELVFSMYPSWNFMVQLQVSTN